MIDPHHLALIGLFAFKRREESAQKSEWKPTLLEATEMERELKTYTPYKITNGTYTKTVHPIDQYLVAHGIAKLDDWGGFIITSPLNWKRAWATYDLLKWKREKDLEAICEQYPEEKAAHEQKLQAIFQGIRELLQKTTLSTVAPLAIRK